MQKENLIIFEFIFSCLNTKPAQKFLLTIQLHF